MMKITIVEMHPPPNFQAAAPAKIPRNGPCILRLPRRYRSIFEQYLASDIPGQD